MRTCPQCQRTYPDDAEFCPRDGTALAHVVTPTEAQLAAGLARRYRIVRRLGAGGMGTVFLAEQIAVGNRPVALKVLLRKLLDDPEFLMRFHNEAASTGRIHHANVVPIYESGQADDGTPYIAMEYLEGETLRQTLKARGALPVPEIVEILQQVARGLNAAHKLGIIHRDLKPDNIFLTPSEEVGEASGLPSSALVKIVDLGIAKLRESATHTLTGTVLGTPAYMSFEQASGMRSDELDARSDIYSLGIVAYEMLAGRVPFHSDTPLGYVRKHLTEEPPPFRAVKPDLPALPEVEKVVMKALRKDRAERHPSVLDFAHDLSSAAEAGTKRFFPSEAGIRGQRLVSSRDDMIRPLQKEARLVAGMVGASSPISAPGHGLQGIGGQLTAAQVAELLLAAEPPSRTKYNVLALLALVLVAVGVWYAFQPPEQPRTTENVSSQAPAKPAAAPVGMVYIPGGPFTMGRDNADDPEETPAHSVTVARFYLDKTPVTNAQYAEFVHATGKAAPSNWTGGSYAGGQGDWPMTNVSWHDAQAYCQWKGGRFPAEAEWEFAARGTDGRLYPWGNEFSPSLSNSVESGLGRPEPVGLRPNNASPFGVLDMSGNVWQWCGDDYHPYPGRKPAFEIPADAKVIRGGSFQSDKDHVTTTTRNLDLSTTRSPTIGFRCAKSP